MAGRCFAFEEGLFFDGFFLECCVLDEGRKGRGADGEDCG